MFDLSGDKQVPDTAIVFTGTRLRGHFVFIRVNNVGEIHLTFVEIRNNGVYQANDLLNTKIIMDVTKQTMRKFLQVKKQKSFICLCIVSW